MNSNFLVFSFVASLVSYCILTTKKILLARLFYAFIVISAWESRYCIIFDMYICTSIFFVCVCVSPPFKKPRFFYFFWLSENVARNCEVFLQLKAALK